MDEQKTERKAWRTQPATFASLEKWLNQLDQDGYMVFRILDNLEDDDNDLTIVAFDPVRQAQAMSKMQAAAGAQALKAQMDEMLKVSADGFPGVPPR